MKKKLIMLCTGAMLLLTGCEKDPDWHKDVLEYYRTGFSTGWRNETGKWNISDEMKSKSYTYGYLLRDLDGDGVKEFLVGIIDDAPETRFTDLYILHRDFGATRCFTTGGEGYYYYICAGDLIRNDSWYGSKTKTEYMKYDSDNNSFPVVDVSALPEKFELTPFQ